jgi:hypothetical protein
MKALTVSAMVLLMAASSRPMAAHEPPTPTYPVQIVRALIDRGDVVRLPVKGHARRSIKKDAEVFAMSFGPSRVVLVRLPDTPKPYELVVRSWLTGLGLTKHVFVPSAIVFSEDLERTWTVPETAFVVKAKTFSKPPRLEGTIAVAPERGARFVLVYTNYAPGERLDRLKDEAVRASADAALGSGAIAGGVTGMFGTLFMHVERGDTGSIEIETVPSKE